jgi:hypothetical protein
MASERLTTIGPFSTKVGNAQRIVPVPWLDCDSCGRRHYPSTLSGRWHIATACMSCGTALAGRASN